MTNFTQIISEDTSQRSLAPKAVASQVALMSVVSGVAIVLFNVLRPRNKVVYEPKVKYHVGEKRPPRISDSLLGWLPPVLYTKEAELVDKIGLDAALFLRFLRMMRWIFTAVAFLCCAVLIPVDITYNLKYIPSDSRNVLSMMTVGSVTGPALYAHIALDYAITFVVMGFIWYNWKVVVGLRHNWFRSPEYTQSFYARTLMVTEVGRKLQSDEGLRAIFQSVQVPYPTTSVHIGRHVGKLPELIEFHNDTVRELEGCLVKYLKDGKIAKKRPTIRIGGFMCFGGETKDAIDYYTEKLRRTELAVENYRNKIDLRRPENYGFASMAAVPYAHIVANMLRNKRPKGSIILLAPNPKDIVWPNLSKSRGEIFRNSVIGWAFLVLVCFFNTIPLFIISILANLASLTSFVPFLNTWSEVSPGSFTFISGVLPPAVSAIFSYLLPIVMRWLSKYQGAYTHSRLDRAVIARYFAFLVISQLIIFTLIGVIFNSAMKIAQEVGDHNSIKTIVENLNGLPQVINQAYIDQSSYWLTYFPLRGFLALFDLAQIINLVVIFVKTHLFGRTPRDHRDWTKPPEFPYYIYYANLLFMGTVGMFFAPLAPLVAAAAMVVFWISSWVYKYQLMFVYVSRVETGGRMWNVIINRVIATVILMQAIMILTIGLQAGFKTFIWISTVPPILFMLVFKVYLTRAFLRKFQYYIPTEEELRVAQIHSKRADNAGNKLEKRFGHPALHAELFTPMVHANMTSLLTEVYSGKIANEETKLDDIGGHKVEAHVVQGIRIAGIDERDLEYDPALYQRDRGELEWDQRSMSSTNLLSETASIAPSKAGYAQSGRGSPAPSRMAGYDRYISQGPQPEIEMMRFDDVQLPLLTSQQPPGVYQPGMQASHSNVSLPASQYSPNPMDPNAPPMPPVPPHYSMPQQRPAYYQQDSYDYRQAPLHRPDPSRQGSWQ